MLRPSFSSLFGVATGAAWVRERDRRQSAERLAAATLETLLNAIDATDEVTGAHVRRTAAYTLILADALAFTPDQRQGVERIALFHDIGKIHEALFDIVHDDDKLSDEERRLIATHPRRGADVLEPLAAFYPELPDGVLAHHERWDGGGYPRKLRGGDIPLAARVVAIVDTFDALTHSRRYHLGESARRGAEIIAAGRGTQFDPRLVDVFLSPDVFACVERTMHETLGARPRRRPDRRHRTPETGVPNVSFRWRAPTAAADASDVAEAVPASSER